MFGSADLCVADRATREAMYRAEQAGQAAEAAATAAVFLGGPPDSKPSSYVGRIRLYRHDPKDAWTRGVLILPGGTAVCWIAYSDGVQQHLALFQSPGLVVVTGHHLAGDLYLTGIRPATEWQDAAGLR